MTKKPSKPSSVTCPDCGYVFAGHKNMFGKICTRCDGYIPPLRELPIVEQNKFKLQIMQAQVIEYLKKKL